MRKVRWACNWTVALWVMVVLAAALTLVSTAQADGRSDTVNQGNAQHLGAADPAPAPPSDVTDKPAADAADSPPQERDSARGAVEVADKPAPATCGICTQDIEDFDFNGPISMAGQHPPSLLFYEPLPDLATVLDKGRSTVSVNLDWTNLIIHNLDSGVVVDYDYEELRSTFDYRQRLGGGELGVRLPVYYRSHGILDRTIEGWHRFFGLPNGLRDSYPEQEFHYTVITRDGVAFNGESDVAGPGDLALSYKQPLWRKGATGQSAAAWRIGVKAPTGDSAQALGSGNWDYSAGLLWQKQFSARLRGYANVDYVVTGDVDWPNIEQSNVVHTMWAAEYAWKPRFTLVAQYSTQDNALKTGSLRGDMNPRELTIGFHHRVRDGLVWSGGFREDISPESAPDFTMMSHLKWEF